MAGEIDEYSIWMVISKAPQDVGSYGSRTNVAKLIGIIENEMGLEIGGSGGAHIGILAPVEVLAEFAKYPYVERIIGNDFGIKYSNEDKTRGIIKHSYDENLYDVSYNVTNARIVHFTNFGFEIKLEKEGILQMTYPIEFTDKIVNIYDNSNATLTSIIANAGDRYEGYNVLELTDEQISIQWNFVQKYPSNYLGFYGDVTVASDPIIEDMQDDSPNKFPKWIKNNAGWWASNQIDDDSFIMGIEYLIKNEIIMTDNKKEGTEMGTDDTRETTIPKWIKNNAGWWAEGKLTDSEFMLGIEYLIEKGIIII